MNKKMFTIIFLFPLLGIIYSQCGDFDIEEDYFADHLIGFYLNSIDVNTGDSSVEYFRYRIKQNNNQIDNLKAHYSLIINSPDLGLSSFELMTGVVDISNISMSELTFSNLDINFSTQSIPGADFQSEESSLASMDELEAIQGIILSSGKIPNGTYILNVTLKCTDDDSITYDSINKTIEAYEPVFLDLLAPGGSLQDTSNTSILNTIPLFTWSSDYCSQCTYGIRVCSYDPSLHSSLSDAIEDVSVLPANQNVDFYPLDNNGSFAYPSQDAFDLMVNNLYVWQIQREYETTLGTQQNKSNIFVFKISSFDDILDDELSESPYQDVLKELLGYKYEELFNNTDGELRGFTIKNNTIVINNQVVPISNLYDILDKLNEGNIELLEIEVE
tara:strand:- start:784 stop:1947 length:1164 start_codon:yes stop_codon:yes gene_type:complete